jgi:hypothetical protein
MPFLFSGRRGPRHPSYVKRIGGRRFGTSVHVNRHGVRRGPWRFSLGKFSCFKQH